MMENGAGSEIVVRVRAEAQPLRDAADDYDALLELVGDARLVLLGEASHGTHEFYRERAEITKRLISEKGFTAVAVEADWPDAYRIHRYVQGHDDGPSIEASSRASRRHGWVRRGVRVKER